VVALIQAVVAKLYKLQMSNTSFNIYQFGLWALDMPYLLIYFLFFAALLKRLWGGKRYYVVPMVISIMDLAENILLLRILSRYPAREDVLVWLCSGFSTLKWVAVGLLILGILGGLFNFFVIRKKGMVTSI